MTSITMQNSAKQLSRAIQLLNNDKLVAIPTETVYGLAGNALSEKAVNQIFRLKNRPFNNPLILHVSSISEMELYTKNIPEDALKLAQYFWPGPLTLILEKAKNISFTITGNKQTVAVRIPDHPLCLELLRNLNFPLVAPSANRSNHISPTEPKHVKLSFGEKSPFILKGGKCSAGLESTIIGFQDGKAEIYRLGAIEKEKIEAVLGYSIQTHKSDNDLKAPGMSKKHYSPKTALIITEDIQTTIRKYANLRTGIIYFSPRESYPIDHPFLILSERGEVKEAASNLFMCMHEMDQLGLEFIIAEMAPNHGLGASINDRLTRAAVQFDEK